MTSETDDVMALWRRQSRYADIFSRRAWVELEDVFLPTTSAHIDTVTPLACSAPQRLRPGAS